MNIENIGRAPESTARFQVWETANGTRCCYCPCCGRYFNANDYAEPLDDVLIEHSEFHEGISL